MHDPVDALHDDGASSAMSSTGKELRYEITKSAALYPEAMALPTESPSLWLPCSVYRQNVSSGN